MSRSARRRLTDRQAAVLAAVERHGNPILDDLRSDFPDLAASVLERVLHALETKGLVEHAGDEELTYTGGVHWWSTALTPTTFSAVVQRIAKTLEFGAPGLRHTSDPQKNSVTVFLPLRELELHLANSSSTHMDVVRACIRELEDADYVVEVSVDTKIHGGDEPFLAVEVRPKLASSASGDYGAGWQRDIISEGCQTRRPGERH